MNSVPHDPAERLKILTEYVNKLAWKNPDINVLRPEHQNDYSEWVRIIQDYLNASHRRGKLILPDLTAYGNQTVGVFSDYAGESVGDHFAYSFLTCAWNTSGPFIERMKEVRRTFGLGNKEINFKYFRMGQLRRALPDYLNAADGLVHGFLLTIVVDKRALSLFGPNERATGQWISDELAKHGLGEWKPAVAEKLCRVVHAVGFLLGLLAESGQRAFWMTDHDSIVPNTEAHKKALDLLGRVLNLYIEPGVHFPEFGGAAPFEDRDIGHLELLSLADITASSVEHYLSRRNAEGSDEAEVKSGADDVIRWLAHDGVSLSKMTIIVRQNDKGVIEAANLEFNLIDPPEGVTYIPVVI